MTGTPRLSISLSYSFKQEDYILLDRKNAKTPEEARALYGKIVTADYFLTGTNAMPQWLRL